ncbi:hypothetical protein GC093_21385 [Paenibacillus sp. LMG 31456]|uniref:Uncharacterized protein n=1 Tax=Paenibacillus foliorum TaxID=2654974 RepID=A0A972GS65_9BACL|nr:hypothetical protein [Paenibacillus foliorum]
MNLKKCLSIGWSLNKKGLFKSGNFRFVAGLLGRGHTDFGKVISAGIKQAEFNGYITVECLAPGPNPFQPDKGEPTMEWIYTFATESIDYLKKHFRP